MLLTGCASGATFLDHITPTKPSPILEEYLGHDLPSVYGISTVGIQSGAITMAGIKKQKDDFLYSLGTRTAVQFNQISQNGMQSFLGLLAASGVIGAPLAYKIGLNKPQPIKKG